MYRYLGDRFTDSKFKGQLCEAEKNTDGKCIRGKNGSMLVQFSMGETVVVIGRLLRKVKPDINHNHEIWICCKVCGEHYDLRMDDKCPNCQTKPQ